MSDDERQRTVRTVRVRRSPKISVFLGLGAAFGALVALVATLSVPPDPQLPTIQALGFLVLLLAPVGALVGGGIAIALDRALARTTRTVEAERDTAVPPPPRAPLDAAADPVVEVAAESEGEPEEL